MASRSLKYLFLAAPLLLAGCGEGWEMQLTNTAFPYGNQRTAGSGVAYVRAQMMPERELNVKEVLTPMLPKQEEVIVEEEVMIEEVVEPVKPADDIFNKSQVK